MEKVLHCGGVLQVLSWNAWCIHVKLWHGSFLLQERVGLSSSDTGKGKSKMSKHITHGYHMVEGKSHHTMEDYVFAQFKQVDDNELGLFAIFDGHLSHEIPDYLRSHLFNNILNEVILSYYYWMLDMYFVQSVQSSVKLKFKDGEVCSLLFLLINHFLSPLPSPRQDNQE